jgi:hypothetical protein
VVQPVCAQEVRESAQGWVRRDVLVDQGIGRLIGDRTGRNLTLEHPRYAIAILSNQNGLNSSSKVGAFKRKLANILSQVREVQCDLLYQHGTSSMHCLAR